MALGDGKGWLTKSRHQLAGLLSVLDRHAVDPAVAEAKVGIGTTVEGRVERKRLGEAGSEGTFVGVSILTHSILPMASARQRQYGLSDALDPRDLPSVHCAASEV